jgi:hypothetical protein
MVPLELWAANSWTVSVATEAAAVVDEDAVSDLLSSELEGDWQAVKERNKSRAEKRVDFMGQFFTKLGNSASLFVRKGTGRGYGIRKFTYP